VWSLDRFAAAAAASLAAVNDGTGGGGDASAAVSAPPPSGSQVMFNTNLNKKFQKFTMVKKYACVLLEWHQ
jgi:hypothetical protein